MKTSTKCNKRLIARVQALVDDDARITIQEISEVLYTSSGSVSNVSSDELRYNKVSARWVLHSSTKENKRDRVVYSKSLLQIYDNCDPRCLHGFLLVMKHGCTAMNLRSTQNRAWVPKGENSPQIAKRNRSQKKVHDVLLCKRNRVTENHVKRRRSSLGNSTESLCLLRSTILQRVFDRTLVCMVSHFFMVTHKCVVVPEYLADENVETLPHFLVP